MVKRQQHSRASSRGASQEARERLGDIASLFSSGANLVTGASNELREMARARIAAKAFEANIPTRGEIESLHLELEELKTRISKLEQAKKPAKRTK